MYIYFLKRFLLIFPTLFIIMLVNFLIIQAAPGGPVEKIISQINNTKANQIENASTSLNSSILQDKNFSNISKYNSYGIDEEIIKKIEKNYGFDLPIKDRFFMMMKKFILFDFGQSFYQDKSVVMLLKEKLPVSISLGIWTVLLTYIISIFLGIKKAVKNNSKFDIYSSYILILLHAIPSFLLAIFLIIFFCGGNFLNIFPLRGLVSSNFDELFWWQKIFDYLWHMALPIFAMTIGGFASLTFFCKNSFIEELRKNYVTSAYAKGLNQNQVLYFHVFRNALMIVIASFPSALLTVFFTSSMLIEVIFSLDGLGLLGYEAVLSRDYPVMFASLYIFTLFGLIANIVSDLIYKIIDPRINFDSK